MVVWHWEVISYCWTGSLKYWILLDKYTAAKLILNSVIVSTITGLTASFVLTNVWLPRNNQSTIKRYFSEGHIMCKTLTLSTYESYTTSWSK
jgi:hypothetical protein